eukprot:94242-Prymnesium_polylepis.2
MGTQKALVESFGIAEELARRQRTAPQLAVSRRRLSVHLKRLVVLVLVRAAAALCHVVDLNKCGTEERSRQAWLVGRAATA